jgi:hypothetical protein
VRHTLKAIALMLVLGSLSGCASKSPVRNDFLLPVTSYVGDCFGEDRVWWKPLATPPANAELYLRAAEPFWPAPGKDEPFTDKWFGRSNGSGEVLMCRVGDENHGFWRFRVRKGEVQVVRYATWTYLVLD